MKETSQKRGFTMVELLVVLAIILILAAIILPTVHKLRDKAFSTQCKANLKALQVAAWNYAMNSAHGDHKTPYASSFDHRHDSDGNYHEHKGWVCFSEYNAGGSNNDLTKWWGDTAEDSVRGGSLFKWTENNTDIYTCPIFERLMEGAKSPDGTLTLTKQNIWRSYAMSDRADDLSLTRLQNASRKLMFSDVSRYNYNPRTCYWKMTQNYLYAYDGKLRGEDYNSSYPWESVGKLHGGYGNAVFMDGHIETLHWSDTAKACQGTL